jgi:hypothetical protein
VVISDLPYFPSFRVMLPRIYSVVFLLTSIRGSVACAMYMDISVGQVIYDFCPTQANSVSIFIEKYSQSSRSMHWCLLSKDNCCSYKMDIFKLSSSRMKHIQACILNKDDETLVGYNDFQLHWNKFIYPCIEAKYCIPMPINYSKNIFGRLSWKLSACFIKLYFLWGSLSFASWISE